ncbi:hypothetical protein KAJ61_02655 [Candidatus Parcubacteria bacterium]|nr:hypothetical protein [Candidatus Parcubacteria bacterium]
MKYKKLLLFLAIFLFIFIVADKAQAQSSAGIKISPVKTEEMVDPGEVFKSQIKVTNESGETRTFYVYLRDFKSEGESGMAKLVIPGTEEGYYLASWIDVSREGIELSPGQERTVPFTVDVPENIGPGGYFGAIILGTEPPRIHKQNEEKGAGMSIAQQTASLLLLRVRGDVFEEAHIREFNTDKDFYNTPFLVDFLIRIENVGNVHIKPHGAISIKNMFGKEVRILKINEKGGNILPRSIRRFSANIWEGKNAFGKYTATLGITYGVSANEGGQGKSSLVAVKTFWIIPWQIIIPVFLTLLFISGIFILLIKLYKNKAVKKAMQRAGISQTGYMRQSREQGISPALHLGVILIIVFVIMIFILTAFYFLFFS